MATTTAPAATAARTRPGRFADALGSEWTKLWSVRSTWWCLAASLALMTVAAFSVGLDFVHDLTEPQTAGGPPDNGGSTVLDPSRTLVIGVMTAQFALVALGMLAICPEFGSGAIRTAFQAEPVRGRVLAAKAAVTGAVVLVWGLLIGAAGWVAGWVALDGHAEFTTGSTARGILGTAVSLALVTVLTVGLGAALRSSAGTLTVALLLLFGLQMFVTGDAAAALPGMASSYLIAASEQAPYGGWLAPLLVVAAWTAAAALVGRTVLNRRDA